MKMFARDLLFKVLICYEKYPSQGRDNLWWTRKKVFKTEKILRFRSLNADVLRMKADKVDKLYILEEWEGKKFRVN